MRHAILVIFAAMLAFAAPKWDVPQAKQRLRVNIPSPANTSVLLPLQGELLDSAVAVQACNDDGKPVPAAWFQRGGKKRGIVLDFSGCQLKKASKNTATFAASIYLLEKEVPELPIPKNDRNVTVFRWMKSLTTRPFTAPEMLATFSSHLGARKAQGARVANFGDILPKWQFPEKGNPAELLLWNTRFFLDEATELDFGADQEHVAWTVLVDAKPVANWSDALDRHGPAVRLEAGLHTLQMLAIRYRGEPLPRLAIRRYAKPFSTELLPGGAFDSLAWETQEKTLHSIRVDNRTTFHFPLVSLFATAIEATASNATLLGSDGQPLPQAGSTAWFLALDSLRPGFRLGTLVMSSETRWECGERLDLVTTVRFHASVLPANGVPDFVPRLVGHPQGFLLEPFLRLEYEAVDAGEIPVAATSKPIAQPFQNTPVPHHAASLRFVHTLLGRPATAPVSIPVAHPADDLDSLTASGYNLLLAGQRAILLCDPLPTQSRPMPPRKSHPTTALLDGFTAALVAPGATQPLTQGKNLLVFPAPPSPGTIANLADFLALPNLLAAKPDVAILFTGLTSFREGLTPQQSMVPLLFLAQSCLAHGITPILVALPQFPTFPQDTQRLTALYTKELALSLAVPVIDLQFHQKRDDTSSENWFTANGCQLATPSNAARAWAAQFLK
ncbi:MAG: hypothetical protein IJJ26_07510 [Victivallales bacterium]|nr:hypothetical protein [Victivallales bacterium]